VVEMLRHYYETPAPVVARVSALMKGD
jgi:hypothetical protein